MFKKSIITFLTFLTMISIQAQPVKKVLLEEFSGNWTGFSPRGFAKRDSIVNANQGLVIPVGFHYADPLANAESDAIVDSFGVSTYPSGMVDRKLFSGQSSVSMNTQDWGYWTNSRLANYPVLSLTISSDYNSATRLSNAHVKIKFNSAKTANMKVHLFYIEDSVINFSPAYNQENYYGAGCSFADPGSPYYNFPCVINGLAYRHVFRHAASPVYGTTGIIPTSVSPGDTFSINYAYTLPQSFDETRITLVAFVSTTDHSVLNAESMAMMSCSCVLSATTTITPVSGATCVNGKIKINITGGITSFPIFELYESSTGNQLALFNAPAGTTSYTFTNLGPGTYKVKIKDGITCCAIELPDKIVKCPAPSSGFLTNTITSNSAKVKWNVIGCTAGYQIQYRILGATSWTTKTSSVANKILNGLSPSTTYQWKVASKCFGSSPAVYSVFSSIQTFTTAPLRLSEPQYQIETPEPISELKIFPVPSSSFVDILFHSAYQQNNIRIVNNTGQVVSEQQIVSDTEKIELAIDITGLSPGIYALIISNKEGFKTVRFVKEK